MEIEESKKAKEYFFSGDYLNQFKNKLEEDETLEKNTWEEKDLIEYYNKKYVKKDELKKIRTIPGSFYKVRRQGGASSNDLNEVNKFYKRALVSGVIVMFQSYCTMQVIY